MTEDDGEEPSVTIAVTPDNGKSQSKRRECTNFAMTGMDSFSATALIMSLWFGWAVRSCCVRPCRPSADTPVLWMSCASAIVSSSCVAYVERLNVVVRGHAEGTGV